jgi:hypothetical protein
MDFAVEQAVTMYLLPFLLTDDRVIFINDI